MRLMGPSPLSHSAIKQQNRDLTSPSSPNASQLQKPHLTESDSKLL